MDPVDTYNFDWVLKRLCSQDQQASAGYRAARFVGLPSFHPEACLDAREGPEGTWMTLYGPSRHLWPELVAASRSGQRDADLIGIAVPGGPRTERLAEEQAALLWRELDVGVREMAPQPSILGLDGMRVRFDYVAITGERSSRVGWSPDPDQDPTLFRTAWTLLAAAFGCFKDPDSRTIIRDLAGYLTTHCAVCFKPLTEMDREVRLLLPAELPDQHPGVEYDGRELHLQCFVDLPDRQALAALARERSHQVIMPSTVVAKVVDGERLGLSVWKLRGRYEAEIEFPEVLTAIRVPIETWPNPLTDLLADPGDLHPLEREALRDGVPQILAVVPDGLALRRTFEEHKGEIRKREGERRREERRVLEDQIRGVREACDRLIERIRMAGLACPHCARSSTDYRFMDSGPRKRPFFICRACGGSFRPEDVHKARPNDNGPAT